MFHIRPQWWDTLARPGVSLATSSYSDDPDEHDRITTRPGSYWRTRANLDEAVRRGIPVRAGIVHIAEGQRVAEVEAALRRLGVQRVHTDRVRAIGRAATPATVPSMDELCGRCGHDQAAVLPSGDVALCVMARFMPCGNVRTQRLADILTGPRWAEATARVPAPRGACEPSDSSSCSPKSGPDCDPSWGDFV